MAVKKQKHDFTVMSDLRCRECGRPIKQNVADRVENPTRCYVCHNLSKGKKKMVVTIGKLLGGRTINKVIDFVQKQIDQKKAYFGKE